MNNWSPTTLEAIEDGAQMHPAYPPVMIWFKIGNGCWSTRCPPRHTVCIVSLHSEFGKHCLGFQDIVSFSFC
jgi:hypothetical protein